MHGFLNIDKSAGPTSHDVVAQVRRLARQKRVGHAGTLDPAATGVLVVALGSATRLVEYVQEATTKRYTGQVHLGIETSTEDAEGEITAQNTVPALSREELDLALNAFRGPIKQIPPMYSALHHEGRRLHELAREGIVVERPARDIVIDRLEIIDWQSPIITLDIICSKGTYIRSLARDIGTALGCGAHLRSLRRTEVGTFHLQNAVTLEALQAEAPTVTLAEVLLPPEHAVADWPILEINADEERKIRNGLPLLRPDFQGERARAHAADGSLLALLSPNAEGRWKPNKVFDWNN
jgi:tRNA pseudouridine55 synthase